jgi:UDPglucose 6-dehydrogenase
MTVYLGNDARLKSPEETVAVLGLGYVGLTTAVCLASRGFRTIGLDIDTRKLKSLERGETTIGEKGLTQLLKKGIVSGLLTFSSSYAKAVNNANIVFIAVGTPSRDDGSIDLSFVEGAAKSLGREISLEKPYKLIVVESTVIPGTTESILKPIIEHESGLRLGRFGLAISPEFLREGSAIEDTMSPDRLILGTDDAKSALHLLAFYRKFYAKGLPKIVQTTAVNAELIKYFSNAFLATKVSFVNEVANLCDTIPGADVRIVAEGMGLDKRIAPYFLNAGLGWGGSCFGKDIRAILSFANEVGAELPIISATYQTNEKQSLKALEFARTHLGNLKGKRIGILGLSFKPDTDDMREAVSIRLIELLLKVGSEVIAYDPVAIPNARRIFGKRIRYAASALACLRGIDCCIIVTEWDEFKQLEPEDFAGMKNPILIDGRRIYDPTKFTRKLRFEAIGLGRPSKREQRRS